MPLVLVVAALLLALIPLPAHAASAASWAVPAAAAQEKKEYLTDEEAEKIRNADTPNDRVTLYLSFADDRLKKFQYELTRKAPEMHRSDMLNALLNGYSGSVDDAADTIQGAIENDTDIGASLKAMTSKGKDFLTALQKIKTGKGSDYDSYSDTLEDAIEGTEDALNESQQALKTYSAPIRRKQ